MTNPISVYFIYYGAWTPQSNAPQLLPLLIASLAGSSRWAVNQRYYQSDGKHVSGDVRFAGSTYVGYPQGQSLADVLAVWQVVVDTVNSGVLALTRPPRHQLLCFRLRPRYFQCPRSR